MFRKRRIQTQIVAVFISALILVATTLQVVNGIQQRRALLDSAQDQGVIAATSLREATRAVESLIVTFQQTTGEENTLQPAKLLTLMMRLADENFDTFVAETPGVSFAALIAPDGTVFVHSTNSLRGQSAQSLNLMDVPVDGMVRRSVANFGDVYLTRMPVDLSGPFTLSAFDIVIGTPAAPIDANLRNSRTASLIVGLGALLVVSAGALFVVRRNITGPILRIREGSQRFRAGELDYRIPPEGSQELAELASTLNQTAQAFKQSRLDLENAYTALASGADEHARDLAISAEIGRIATGLRDTTILLRETVDQICKRFDVIYHAQIFLLDEPGEFAVLVESSGDAGQQLLRLGHKLAVGSSSVIGRVTLRGRPVIASDTLRDDTPWQPNPILPDTRAEMALPLTIEGRVIGALDVQSKSPDVFTDDMIRVFHVLADQIAIAIDNARLLADSEQRVREIDSLNRQLTRTAWSDYMAADRQIFPSGYRYDRMATHPLDSGASVKDKNQVEARIQVHGEIIGTLAAAFLTASPTEEDRLFVEAVADRVALAVENARLFDQTQRALAETERLYETARTVSSVTELDTIFQLVAEQLSTTSGVDDIDVLLSGPDPVLVQFLETVYSWHRPTSEPSAPTRERLGMFTLETATHGTLPSTSPLLYNDIARELPANHPLKPRLQQLNAASAVIVPMTASGHWFGLVVITSRAPGSFQDTYAAFASALADQIAIALENRRLFTEVQSEARRARALAEAGQLASRIGQDYAAGLQNLFQAVAGPGNYDRWWFGVLSNDGHILQRITASDHDLPDAVSVADGVGALAEAARIEEIVLINDPHDYPLLGQLDSLSIDQWGKHMAVPVKIGAAVVGVLLIGRDMENQNLDERDIQLAATLASQIAIATQNRQLFDDAETQRERLQTIVDTMPAGVLVMDRKGDILLSNQTLMGFLGPQMQPGTPELPQPYPIVRAGTQSPYPRQEWPLSRVLLTGETAAVDDMVVLKPDGSVMHMLAQAAPIRDQSGNVIAAVGAFQDITELQELESALQDSLRETTQLYEASWAISHTTVMEELLQTTLSQMARLGTDFSAVIFREEDTPGSPELHIAACQPEDRSDGDTGALFGPLLDQKPLVMDRAAAPAKQLAALDALGVELAGSFPLTVRGSVTGWLVAGFAQSQPLTAEQQRFLTTLADQAAVAIENQRLLLRTAEALEETATLYHASRLIADAHNPDDILTAFVDFAARRPIDHAALYMILTEAPDISYAAVELVAIRDAGKPDVPALHSRFRADAFPFWNLAQASEITWMNPIDPSDHGDTAGDMFAGLGLHSVVIVPLHVAERPLGVIVFGTGDPWPEHSINRRIFEALADQAAVSLENTQLYQEARRRARQLTLSTEISRAVTSILHLDNLLPQVANQIREAFEYDHVQVFMLSDDGTQANLVASTGSAGQQLLALKHSLPVGSQSVIGQVTATGQPQIALDTADARVVHRPNPLLPQTRSEMALPLIARGQIAGALDVQSNQPGAFTEEDARILQSLADMVAAAIDNARLFELAEQRADEMGVLFIVTTAAAASSDLDESLNQAVVTLRDALNVTSASIYLPEENGQYMVKGADVGHPSQETKRSLIDIERGLVGWVARHQEAVIIDDLARDPRRLSASPDTRSAMAVPLQSGGGLAGVLVVESERTYGFNQDDLRLLQTLSGSLAAIIQNNRLLREVQEANEQLLEVDRLKTNFLAAMSHELRTPLNSIIGFSRVILKGIDGPLTETQEQDLTSIYESGRHLLGLVNDILDQAKIQAGKMELSFGYFELNTVIKGVMSSAVGFTRDRPIQLHSEIADELPEAYGDEFRTRQVLLNLVSNASKFTEDGSITVSAFPVMLDDQVFLQVSVSDTGIGIAQKDMHKLFEAFQQVDNSLTRKVGGTGMGLPLAKSFAELQGGIIWVESEPEIGSTFSFTIPTTPTVNTDQEAPDATDEAETTRPDTPVPPDLMRQRPKSMSVMAVEQDVEIISLYRRYLARAGYEVFGITHTEEVLEMASKRRPDIILLDVNLHNQAGWDLLDMLKGMDLTRSIPVVVCSLNPDRTRALEAGAAEYIFKPFSEEQLVNAFRRIEAIATRQRILLVDDQPETVSDLLDVLTASAQYDVLCATDGAQALDIIARMDHIDLVILDLRMPGVDGFEVVRMLRAEERTAAIPVLVLTADDITTEERAALDAIAIYRKNTDEERLLDSIAAQLQSTKEQQ